MFVFFGIIFTFVLLISSVYLKIFVAYPLFISLIIFMLIAMRGGFNLIEVIKMAYNGGKKAFIVLKIFIIIGAIISIWIAAGTVPAIVYFGIKFINPNIFILSAFLITSLISFLIGTSFGTIGTVGIAFMVMGRTGGVNVNVLGGAIIAGAYFGDRCSPMSSSANLVANITDTDLYINIKNMFRTSALPFVISLVGYLILSFIYPLNFKGTGMADEIARTFKINFVVLLPALSLLTFTLLRIEVKLSMTLSIIEAFLITILVQHESIIDSFKYLFFGFSLKETSSLGSIMEGGGILSMVKVATVVFISSAFAGVFEGAGILKYLETFLERANKREHIFIVTTLLSIATAAFGCSQALAIILTHQLAKGVYIKNNLDNYELALDVENTAVVISPLIPWNIAGLVPATSLGITSSFIPFAFYLYLIPLINIIFYTNNPKAKVQ